MQNDNVTESKNLAKNKFDSSPKNVLCKKPENQSEFSVLLNDINFTPLRNAESDYIEPQVPLDYCAVTEKNLNFSKEVRVNPEVIKNISFELDNSSSSINSNKNDIFEIHSSPIKISNVICKITVTWNSLLQYIVIAEYLIQTHTKKIILIVRLSC